MNPGEEILLMDDPTGVGGILDDHSTQLIKKQEMLERSWVASGFEDAHSNHTEMAGRIDDILTIYKNELRELKEAA